MASYGLLLHILTFHQPLQTNNYQNFVTLLQASIKEIYSYLIKFDNIYLRIAKESFNRI
jgi:hypothetical protein